MEETRACEANSPPPICEQMASLMREYLGIELVVSLLAMVFDSANGGIHLTVHID
jgi:hypothetical protein